MSVLLVPLVTESNSMVLVTNGWVLTPAKKVGINGSAVKLEPAPLPSDQLEIKFVNPLTVVFSPAIAFKSLIKPELDVSQKISKRDSTGEVSNTPNNILYVDARAAACNEPIGNGRVDVAGGIGNFTLPWDILAMYGFVSVWYTVAKFDEVAGAIGSNKLFCSDIVTTVWEFIWG